jgi:hypothetical protein
MIRPSFVPPPPIRKLRDLARYRADLVAARTAEKNRVEKLLEDAQIKLSVVVSDIFGVSGRDMLAALVAGERNPKALAQLARHTMRKKITVLEEAFTGHFTGHHAFLLGRMLARVDAITSDIADLDARIEEQIVPFAAAVAKLDEVPGISLAAAHAILAEIGLDMGRFPTANYGVPSRRRTREWCAQRPTPSCAWRSGTRPCMTWSCPPASTAMPAVPRCTSSPACETRTRPRQPTSRPPHGHHRAATAITQTPACLVASSQRPGRASASWPVADKRGR